MEEEAYRIVLDQIITNTAKRGAYKAIQTQTRIDSFIEINAALFSEEDVARALSGAATTTVLEAEINSIRNGLVRLLKDSVIETAQTARETRQKIENGPDQAYGWQVNSGNPCPDCQDRNGQVHSMEYWDAIGTPGTGVTICGNKCKCALNPVN